MDVYVVRFLSETVGLGSRVDGIETVQPSPLGYVRLLCLSERDLFVTRPGFAYAVSVLLFLSSLLIFLTVLLKLPNTGNRL